MKRRLMAAHRRPGPGPRRPMEFLYMSMPSFPPNGADLTREEALTMIIASIAMEELALSHILNAEGEKLQYILGTLPGAKPCASPRDVLAVNKSVTALLEAVTQNQMLLKSKLEKALEACPPPVPPCPPLCPQPCPPPCGPCCPLPRPGRPEPREKSALQLAGQREGMLWNRGCRLPWRQRVLRGEDIRWSEEAPTQIRLDLGKTYAVQYTLNVCAMRPSEETGTILLRQTPCGAFTEALPLRFSVERFSGRSQTLRYAAVLHPSMEAGGEAELSLVLDAGSPLCVERAAMDVAEL